MSLIQSHFLGIDVGGTDVKVGIVDESGTFVARKRVSTSSLVTPDRVFQYAIDFARAHSDTKIRAVGLAVPGVLDTAVATLREVVNLPGWLGVPLRDLLGDISGLPSEVVNDANAAAYAEHSLRSLGDASLALVTLGTGVGSGVVLTGRPYGGDHGCAGELGHIAVDFGDSAVPCTCGSRGHLESYAGAGAVVRRFQHAILDRPGSVPEELRGADVSPRDIAGAAEEGNDLCIQIVEETGHFVGRAIGMMGQVADPKVVLLGGAMTFGGHKTNTGQRFLDAVKESVRQTTLVQVGGNMTIEFASLGNDAGVLGAAKVAQRVVDRNRTT